MTTTSYVLQRTNGYIWYDVESFENEYEALVHCTNNRYRVISRYRVIRRVTTEEVITEYVDEVPSYGAEKETL